MEITTKNVEWVIDQLLLNNANNPAAEWMKKALFNAIACDPVEAANQAALLSALLNARCDAKMEAMKKESHAASL